ncbi:MAG: serine/threonine-protein kinase [Planctomycetales bacterium]
MKFTFAPEATPLSGFTIKRAIDRGGFGEVYYALSDSGKEVALKLLQRNQQIELRGVRQCLNLKHPNLVTIFDIKTDADGDHWVVMEFVSGKCLEQVLQDHPKGLPVSEVEQWLNGMAAGIDFLHDRGIVHRDLKPANVFRENGVVKIGDVGLSKFITPSRRSAQTESVGTVYYMAPEVAHGRYGSELDVYSLGIMLYEMLTGRVPFDGESTGEILMKHLTEPPNLQLVSPAFRPVLSRALEKDPQRRTPGARALADEFRRAARGEPVAMEIPATHFVDVQHLEKQIGQASRQAVNGAANGVPPQFARTLSQPATPAGRDPASFSHSHRMHNGWQRFSEEVRGNRWLAVSIVIAILTIVPSYLGGFPFGGGRFALAWLSPLAFIYLTYWFITNAHRLAHKPGPGTHGDAARRGPPAAAPVAAPLVSPPVAVVSPAPVAKPAPPVAAFRPAPVPTPTTVRPIALRSRVADLTSSMTLAVFWSLTVSVLLALAARKWEWPNLALPGSSSSLAHQTGLFALTTILGSWAVLLIGKWWEGTGKETSGRRLVATALGAAVGACGFWFGNTLFVEPTFDSVFPGMVEAVGQFPLLEPHPEVSINGFPAQTPTLAGFVTFFAALFALRRWWWQADAFRVSKVRLRSLLFTGFVAYFIPALLRFPQGWGVAWAMAISTVVQLSAPWIAPGDRPALVAAKPATAAAVGA